jgi:hypothetical protein
MSKSTKRVLRVSLAVAGMAVLCATYAGTAAAAPSAPDPNVSDSVSGGDAADGATGATGGTKAPQHSKLSDNKLLHNDVLSADIPKIKGSSYEASGLWVMPARDPGDNEDEDNLCHGTGGTQKLPGEHGKFQHPCQTSGNHIGSHGNINGIPFLVPAEFPSSPIDRRAEPRAPERPGSPRPARRWGRVVCCVVE